MTKVLVFDDDPLMNQFVGILLQMGGYEYHKSANESDTLVTLRGGSMDLLILNFPPGDNIYKVIKADKDLAKIGMIVLLPKDGTIDDTGNDRYLVKPFAPEDLLIAAKAVLEHYGKASPSLDEQRFQFERHHTEWQRLFKLSNEEIEKHTQELLEKATTPKANFNRVERSGEHTEVIYL